jgi:fucose 4-O-acetylase-like acetyltransferase
MEQQREKRSDSFDIAKAFGIIAVVYGHAAGPFSAFVFLYHLALFFFISGYFYKDGYTEQPLSLVKKRIKSLYVPFIAYGLIFGLLHNFFYRINLYSDLVPSVHNRTTYLATPREFIVNLLKILSFAKLEQLLATLWFLPVLFCVNMLFLAANYALLRTRPGHRAWWLSVVMVCLFCMGFVYYPEHNIFLRPVSIAMVVTLIFYFGYLFKKYEGLIAFRSVYALSCFLVLVISTRYGTIDTGGHVFGSPFFYIGCSLAGIYLNLYIARLIVTDSPIKRFLIYCGRNTIAIMALHLLAFRGVNYLQVRLYDLPPYMTAKHPVLDASHGWWIPYLIAGVLFPLLVRLIYDSLKQALFKTGPNPGAA